MTSWNTWKCDGCGKESREKMARVQIDITGTIYTDRRASFDLCPICTGKVNGVWPDYWPREE